MTADALGISNEWWTAIGSLGTIAALVFSLWVHHRKDSGAKSATVETEFESPAAGEDSAAEDDPTADDTTDSKWPPDARFEDTQEPVRLKPIRTGGELLAITRSALAYSADNDDPPSPEDAEQVGDAQSVIFSWVEASDVIDDPGEWVRAGYELTELIEELAASGWTIYGGIWKRTLVINGESTAWPIAVVRIRKKPEANAA